MYFDYSKVATEIEFVKISQWIIGFVHNNCE